MVYAIACKFPDQKRFQTMDVAKGEQVGSWMRCTIFHTIDRANEVLEKIKPIMKNNVELKVVRYTVK